VFYFSCQEGVKTENDHINLKVAGQDGSVVQFKIKRHTPLNKLMKAYCERQVKLFYYSTASFTFLYINHHPLHAQVVHTCQLRDG